MVPKIDKVLFASDLTEISRHAFQYASSLAARYDASLVLVCVIEKLAHGVGYNFDSVLGEGTAERLIEERKATARSTLIGKRREDQNVRSALAEYYGTTTEEEAEFEVVIAEGEVEEEVVKVAEEKRCDVIVMGSHRGILGRTSVSGVTKNVLKHTRIPVLVVPPPE